MSLNRANNILVGLIILLSLIASSYGFFSNKAAYLEKTIQTINGDTVTLYGKGLYYNDSVSLASQARAQDIITLFAGIPLLIISLFFSNRNSLKGRLVLTGILGYFLYTYISYSFLATYNKFFLIYVVLMTLSLFSFIINFTSPELKEVKNHFKPEFPNKYFGVFCIITGLIICLMWLGRIIPSIGKLPAELEHYTTMVIQAMDLGLIVPVAIMSGILLLKNKSLGYLLTSVIAIKGAALSLALVMMIIFQLISGVNVHFIEIITFSLFALFFSFNLFLLFRNIK